MLANGVERLFYHAGTRRDGDRRGQIGRDVPYAICRRPRKLYAAQAVMAGLFTPDSRFGATFAGRRGPRIPVLRDGQRPVAVVWAVAEMRRRGRSLWRKTG